MATCTGKRKSANGTCHGQIYRCKKCGNAGCDYNGCSNQAFKYDKCLKCSSSGQKDPVKDPVR